MLPPQILCVWDDEKTKEPAPVAPIVIIKNEVPMGRPVDTMGQAV